MATNATRVLVVFPYTATDRNQLTLRPGEKIRVLQTTSRGWSIGTKDDGTMGLFPSAYCKEDCDDADGGAAPHFSVPQEQKFSELARTRSMNDSVKPQSSSFIVNRSRATSFVDHRASTMRRELGLDGSGSGGAGGTGPQPSSSLFETVAELRALRAAVEADGAKIQKFNRSTAAAEEALRADVQRVAVERQRLVEQIQRDNAKLLEIQTQIEVARCTFMGEPLPASSLAEPEKTAADTALQQDITDPSEIDDPQLRKTALKYRKRTQEAEAIEAEEQQMLRKLEKKCLKHDGTIAELRQRIRELSSDEAVDPAKAEAHRRLEEARKELEEANAKLADLDKVKAKLSKKVAKATAIKGELVADMDRLRDASSSVSEALSRAKKDLARSQAEFKGKEAARLLLSRQLQEATAAEEEENRDLKKRIAKERERIAAYRDAISKFRADGSSPAADGSPTTTIT